MNSEEPQSISLMLPPPQSPARAYPWWGLGLGFLLGVFLGHPVAMVVQNIQEAVITGAPLAPLSALRHSFHFIIMWPMTLLYGFAIGAFGAFLGYIFKRLKEHELLLALLHHEFELQVATLRHHYKNLAIGIRGFSQRVRRKVGEMHRCLAQCAAKDCPACGDFRQEVAVLEHNVEILDDAARRLSETLGQELLFLRALTSDELRPEKRDLYPAMLSSLKDLLDLRFRDKGIRVEINGRPWEECRDSLIFSFEPQAMEVILQNLFSNAMKYGDHVRVVAEEAQGWVRLEIADNGPGLAVESLKHHLATSLDRREEDSTHLGLKVSLHLLEKWGGHLAVRSRPGQGATFIISFPQQPRP
ncbi:MAG TPA: sensor histidine kinase [Desulfobaccales bacterium]